MAAEQQKPKKEKKYFFRDFKTELKKVIWPTPKQLVNSTVAVVTIVLIVAVIVSILDFTFDKMNHYGVEGVKRLIQNTESTEENLVETENLEVTGNEVVDTETVDGTENIEQPVNTVE